MSKSYSDICKAAEYKLTGHGNRHIEALIESFRNMDPSIDADVYGYSTVFMYPFIRDWGVLPELCSPEVPNSLNRPRFGKEGMVVI